MKHLRPRVVYELKVNGQMCDSAKADKAGQISFTYYHKFIPAKVSVDSVTLEICELYEIPNWWTCFTDAGRNFVSRRRNDARH